MFAGSATALRLSAARAWVLSAAYSVVRESSGRAEIGARCGQNEQSAKCISAQTRPSSAPPTGGGPVQSGSALLSGSGGGNFVHGLRPVHYSFNFNSKCSSAVQVQVEGLSLCTGGPSELESSAV